MSESAFDPDKYLEDTKASEFDPDAYLADDSPSEHKNEMAEAALQGFGDSSTLGYLPQIQASLEPFTFGIMNMLSGKSIKPDDYLKARDSYIKMKNRLAEENPEAYYGGVGAGAVTTAIASSPLTVAKGAGAASRILDAAVKGGTAGFASNPGDIEGIVDPAQLTERAQKAAIGSALGGTLQGAGEVVSKATKPIQKYLGSLANEKAVKAAGAMKRDMDRLGPEKVQDLGSQLLEEKIVTFLARPKDIAARIEEASRRYLEKVKDLIKRADEKLGFEGVADVTPDQIRAVGGGKIKTSDLKQSVIDDILKSFEGVPEEELAPALNKVEVWFNNRPEYMSVSQMDRFKKSLNDFIRKTSWAKDQPPMAQEGLMAVRRGAKRGVERMTDIAGTMSGESPGQVKELNRRLGNMIEAEDIATDRVARDAGNRTFGLTDFLSGGAGTAAGGPGTGLAAMIGSKLLRSYGDPAAAVSLNLASKIPFETLKSMSSPAATALQIPIKPPPRVLTEDDVRGMDLPLSEKAKRINDIRRGKVIY